MTDPTADHIRTSQPDKIDDDFGAGSGDQIPADGAGPVFGVEPAYGGIHDVLSVDMEGALLDSGPEVRDHRGEDPSFPPGDHDDSGGDPIVRDHRDDPIVRDHRDGPLDDFYFDAL